MQLGVNRFKLKAKYKETATYDKNSSCSFEYVSYTIIHGGEYLRKNKMEVNFARIWSDLIA